MKTNTKLVMASLISVLMSCQAYNYGTNAEPVQKSNLTFGMVKSKIVKNETSQDEIIKLFGSPNLITKNKSNNEVWSYNKMSVQNKAGSTGPLFGTNRASESSSSQSFDLIVTFDSSDKVLDYSVISTSY
jgi:hypothetical protein